MTKDATDNFVIYRIKGVGGTQVKYIDFNTGGKSVGRKISVYGDLDGDAIITAPVYQAGNEFYRWTVTGGVLNATQDLVSIADTDLATWTYNCDVVYSSATDVNADYFMSSYASIAGSGDRFHLWMDGKNNTIKYKSPGYSVNWVPNAVDYLVFNGVGFMASITINGFTWGADDVAYLYDTSKNNLDETALECDKGVYGAFPTNSIANGNQTGDVALRLSEDGYYMYAYFMFSGGQVDKVQFDCLNM